MPEIQGKCKKCHAWVTNNTSPPCVFDNQVPDTCGLMGQVETRTVETFDEQRAKQASEQSDAVDWEKLGDATFKRPYPDSAPEWLEASPEPDMVPMVTDTSAGRYNHRTGIFTAWDFNLEDLVDTPPVTGREKQTLDEFLNGGTKAALDVQVGGSHYKDSGIQPIEYIFANDLGFCEGNVIKYVTRYRKKNGVQDLKKARHYLDLLIEQLEKPHAG